MHPLLRTLFSPAWRLGYGISISIFLSLIFPIVEPPVKTSIESFCSTQYNDILIKDEKLLKSLLSNCKSANEQVIKNSLKITNLGYFLIQIFAYLGVLSALVTLFSAGESKPLETSNGTFSINAFAKNKDVWKFANGFSNSLADCVFVKDKFDPLGDNFWNFNDRGEISKYRILGALANSLHLLSPLSQDKIGTILLKLSTNPNNTLKVDEVSLIFTLALVSLGHKPSNSLAKEIAFCKCLVVFKDPSIGHIGNGVLPNSLSPINIQNSEWIPLFESWTILAKCVKSDSEVDGIYNISNPLVYLNKTQQQITISNLSDVQNFADCLFN